MRIYVTGSVAALSCLLLTTSCSHARADDQDVALNVTFARRASIGGTGDTLLALRSLFASGVGVDAEDRIYVLDAPANRVGVFTRAGRFLAWRGGAGSGPGEIANAFSARLAVSSRGELWVYDRGKGNAVGYDANGTLLPERPLRPGGLLWGLGVYANRALLLLTNRGDSVVLRRQSDERAETLAVRALPARRSLAAERCGLSGHSDRPVFTGGLPWTLRDSTLAFAPSDSAVIVVATHSGETRRLERAKRPVRADAALAAQTMPSGWSVHIEGQGPCTIAAAEVVAQIGFVPTVPMYASLVLDGRGRMWAMRTVVPGAPRQADVFAIDGGYVGTVNIGAVNPVAFLSDGSVVSLEVDANEVPVVVVYAVRESGDGTR